ncbi:conserved hypothetical protein [Verticillium alfalfae VaMs.102]|uniref:STB6-like N-terminal domain-containing protein n=1 Tax=Verticillium alfalfae (strain VaMs.102 / ATCC MYA-4576 / FGSC 10136) TaxID=526221 RepID=C9SQW4_VERA1|nr:conserved hypothetical protein [Verticillium alfalfae VaMs.102]EEY21239.1 conserved hypothetical protein [Verticillium alfalfae VaMs.102]
MSFRFPFPVPPDPWSHREEEVTLARVNSSPRNARTASGAEVNGSASSRKDASGDSATSAPAPLPQKEMDFCRLRGFRYLEDDPAVIGVERRRVLRAYELYLAEQWACFRESPNTRHSHQYHARPKETDEDGNSIGNWWTEVGAEYYNIEPTDGILGPTTVAALLGMLSGARNRLHYLGAPVAKDVFDIDCTKRGISWFQRSQKLEKTRRLDRQTVLKLHSVTAKAAAGEGWGVQKAVKSTVAEIGGKRGELVIGLVGGRDKGAIGDIETLDISKFVDLVSGERAKWLWLGKPKRTALESNEKTPDMSAILFGEKEAKEGLVTPSRRVQSLPLEEEVQRTKEEPANALHPVQTPIQAATMNDAVLGEKDPSRRGVFKSVAGRVSDARSGLGRIKDTIGGSRRGHASRPSRDDFSDGGYATPSTSALQQNSALSAPPVGINRAFTWKNKPEEYLNSFKKEAEQANEIEKGAAEGDDDQQVADPPSRVGSEWSHAVSEPIKEEDNDDAQPQERGENIEAAFLQRRHSIEYSTPSRRPAISEARWPRRLSFGDAEEAVLRWEEVTGLLPDTAPPHDPLVALKQQAGVAELARALYGSIYSISNHISPWVVTKVGAIEALDAHYTREHEEIQGLYYQLSEAYQRVKQGSSELIASERGRLTEAIREVEVLAARLDYEVNALGGKVGDVEDGVLVFERQVEDVEARAEELKATLETEGWLHWFVRTLTGIGTGPNITRGVAEAVPPDRGSCIAWLFSFCLLRHWIPFMGETLNDDYFFWIQLRVVTYFS